MIAFLVCSHFAAGQVDYTRDSVGRALQRLSEEGFPSAPAPLTRKEREAIWATLPANAEPDLDQSAKTKIEQLQRILAAHDRSDAIRIKVARLPYACAALYQRGLLILADHTVRILEAEELQAVVAHELGHEYYWAEYYEARDNGDREALQAAELLADAVAIRTLVTLGMNPDLLISAVRKIDRYNARLGLRSRNKGNYPPEKERAEFHRIVAWLICERSGDPRWQR
jgi:hypothetical protein